MSKSVVIGINVLHPKICISYIRNERESMRLQGPMSWSMMGRTRPNFTYLLPSRVALALAHASAREPYRL